MRHNRKAQQKELFFEKYGLNIKSQLQSISKIIADKKKKSHQDQNHHLFSATFNKQPSFSTENTISHIHYSNMAQTEKAADFKRKLIYNNQMEYDSESYHSSIETNKDTQKSCSETMSSVSSGSPLIQEPFHQLSIEDFRLLEKLGQGKFGQVYLGVHVRTNLVCAVKKIKKEIMTAKLIVQITRQIKIQFNLNHPNIVKLYSFFSDNQFLYLVQELCYSGQLYSFLRQKKRLRETTTKNIVQQICKALQYMHDCEIIHRDIKPENIIFQNGLIKICDFGWSISSKTMRETFCGTPLYVSPELLKKKNYNNKIDVWSVGILTYELLFGRVPFEITNEQDFIKIVEDEIKFLKLVQISQEAKDFIRICLQKDPRDRFTISELLEHPFISCIQNPLLGELY